MLTVPSWLAAGRRWPSNSTRVRWGPKFRSESVLPPLLVLPLPWLRGVRPPRICGSLFKASGMSLGVVFANSVVVTTVIGVGELRLSLMRVPVIWISSLDTTSAALTEGSDAVALVVPGGVLASVGKLCSVGGATG